MPYSSDFLQGLHAMSTRRSKPSLIIGSSSPRFTSSGMMGNITFAVPMSRYAWAYGSTWTENPTCQSMILAVFSTDTRCTCTLPAAARRQSLAGGRTRPATSPCRGLMLETLKARQRTSIGLSCAPIVATLHEHGFWSEKEITRRQGSGRRQAARPRPVGLEARSQDISSQ